MRINKLQKSVFIICLLPFFGVMIAQLTKGFRYSDHRYLYLTGVLICYLSWLTAFLWGLVNSILIIKSENQKLYTKSVWTILSLLPIIYFIIIALQALPENDNIVLTSGEHISGYYRDKLH